MRDYYLDPRQNYKDIEGQTRHCPQLVLTAQVLKGIRSQVKQQVEDDTWWNVYQRINYRIDQQVYYLVHKKVRSQAELASKRKPHEY